jgi:hypothetical protein
MVSSAAVTGEFPVQKVVEESSAGE